MISEPEHVPCWRIKRENWSFRRSGCRELSNAVHAATVQRQLAETLKPQEGDPDLLTAVLLLAALDNDELEIKLYRDQVDALAADFQSLWSRTAI